MASNNSTQVSVEEMFRRNEEYAKTHVPAPFIEEAGDALKSSVPRTIIFSCVDKRANPFDFLGITDSDAMVIRNVGGDVAPNLNALITIDHLFQFNGGFENILVIQHTDCGTLHVHGDSVKQDLKEHHRGNDKDIDELELGVDLSLDERVRVNVQVIKDSPYIRQELKDRTRGLIYDIKTGKLTQVV